MAEPQILLIEDNMNDVHMVMRRLREAPFSVRHARTGTEGLRLAADERFYAILVDHRLPDMAGTDVCRQLRELGLDIPILVVSSIQDERLVQQALDAGATDYLVKDIVMPHLDDFLAKHVVVS